MQSLLTAFETVDCPLCQGSRYQVVRASSYPETWTPEQMSGSYSASSHHVLMDQVVRCTDCNMHYVNPRPRPDIVMESYASAVDPAFIAQNSERIRTFGRLLKQALRILGEPGAQGRRSLDVGCAGGAFLVAARDLGFNPVGVEPSRWLADYARKTYNVDVRDGILTQGMFAEQSFDLITIWDVIEHVPDPHSVIELINSLLKPNGVLLLSYPDVDSTAARLLGRNWPFWLSVHLHYYNRQTIARQLERGGFKTLASNTLWQTLPLSYVLQRAGHYFAPFNNVATLADNLGAGKLPCSYQMGQTWIVARKMKPSGTSPLN